VGLQYRLRKSHSFRVPEKSGCRGGRYPPCLNGNSPRGLLTVRPRLGRCARFFLGSRSFQGHDIACRFSASLTPCRELSSLQAIAQGLSLICLRGTWNLHPSGWDMMPPVQPCAGRLHAGRAGSPAAASAGPRVSGGRQGCGLAAMAAVGTRIGSADGLNPIEQEGLEPCSQASHYLSSSSVGIN
jgi:hypothetical protein